MDAVTYPDERTQLFLSEKLVAFKPRIDEHEELARRFGVTWTPGLVWLTPDGEACHRNVGFFQPEEFIAECLFACGQVAAGQSDWETAQERFHECVSRWPRTHAAPAALYWAGVAAKKASGEAGELLEFWKRLLAKYEGDSWAKKVAFIEKAK